MKLINLLIRQLLNRKNMCITQKSVKEQMLFLSKLPVPNDDFIRSYNQYQCQKFIYNSTLWYFLLNICSCFLLFIILLVNIIICHSHKYLRKKQNNITTHSIIMAFDNSTTENPSFVPTKFGNIVCFSLFNSIIADKEDLSFIYKIYKRYPLSFFFVLKNLLKIFAYSGAIHKYRPQWIICSCEYSFTSSILTNYCEQRGISHINVMHGEKLFFIRDAFCRFTQSYVWDEYYINLFKSLRHDNNQKYYIEIPPCLSIITQDTTEYIYDYTYYLQSETVLEIKDIMHVLIKMQQNGYTIKIRPHPRYSNMQVLSYVLGSIHVEDCSQIPLALSFATTKKVIAKFSTVLNQAYYASLPIIIDDITNPNLFEYLKESHYIMLSKNHGTWSEELRSMDVAI